MNPGTSGPNLPSSRRPTIAVRHQGAPTRPPRRSLREDRRADPRYLGVLGGSRAEISVPLLVRGRAIGVLDVQVRQAGVFRDQDELLLREVAERLAPMLYHAALYEESQRLAAELEVVADMARVISSQTRPDAVPDEVHDPIRPIR